MENKEIIITIAIILALAYFYWQTQPKNLTTQPVENAELQELRTQANYYQKLYQTRVAKDLEQQEYSRMLNQKIEDLENSLLNLAKQKIKGKKDAERLVNNLETNWKQDKDNWEKEKEMLTNNQKQQEKNLEILQKLQNFHQLVAKASGPSLDRSQVNQAEALVEQITQPEIKQLASWMITDSAFVLGHNNLLTKLAGQEDKLEEIREQNKSLTHKNQDLTEELKIKGEFYQQELAKSVPSTSDREHQEQLRKINLLFDEQAKDYEIIDFNGLYSLLENIKAEREQESESKNKGWWRKN